MNRTFRSCTLLGSLVLLSCNQDVASLPGIDVTYTEERAPCRDRNPLRNLYFGDLHYHTRHSWDAFGYELTVSPAEAYAFARGSAPVRLPPLDGSGHGTREVRLERPLDFAAGTDHAELYGELRTCLTPGLPGHDSPACQRYRALGEQAVVDWGVQLVLPDGKPRQDEICGTDGAACRAAARPVWEEIRSAAEEANDRTAACSFAAFVGYEYTASPNVANQHRNVIFRNAKVPDLPVTYYEQPRAAGLWRELARQCLDAGTGCEALVIPHNANWSNGTLFASSYLDEQSRAVGLEPGKARTLRARLEGAVEIQQHKGDMECTPGLSTWSSDPHCSFEKIRFLPFEDCGEKTSVGGVKDMGCLSRYDFLRGVLLLGLLEERRYGLNPYRLAVVGGTDSHNGTPGNTEEQGWPGHVGVADDSIEERLGRGNSTHRGLINNPGGLTAVWAVERSRDAIWEALRRRETFSTSGTRISVRFFAGWDLPDGICAMVDRVEQGYRRGVAMGGLLPGRPPEAGAPRLFVEAVADPGTVSRPGTPLQQLHIVKGWLDAAGQPREKVFVVAGDPGNSATVDPSTCQASGSGAQRLCALFVDPDFEAGQPSFYYARVLENPSCRWSTRDCNALPVESRPAGCSDPNVQKIIQERALTSPIWYTP